MLSRLHSYMDTFDKVETPPFSLQTIPNFPYDEYSERISVYTEAENWYSGKVLEDAKAEVDGTEVELYPVKINPIRTAVQKHTFALFGETGEDDRALVSARLVFHDDSEKELAEQAEDVLNQVWYESNGRAIQWQNGALAQIYGGCVFRIAYDPTDKLKTYQLRIENPHPKYFIGRPSANDIYRLKEAWLVKPISQEEAAENGFVGGFESASETPWLIEHFTDSRYEAWINTQEVKRFAEGEGWIPTTGTNQFGFVPVVYIPHIRVTGFYGENMFDHTKGVVKELNLRVADYGDAVSADAHAYVGMKNVQGAPDVVQIAPGLNAVNLGNALGFSGNQADPDLWDLNKDRASETMLKLVEMLYEQFRRDAYVPKVADGEDEGSQRSGLTLAMRMLSLLWHTQSERVFWNSGINMLNRMILRMCVDAVPESKMTIKHATLRQKLDWAPVLPRDREMLVNEVVQRMNANVSAPETLFGILGDIQDTDDEIKGIIDFQKQLAKALAEAQPPNAFGAPSGGKPTKKKPKKVSTGATTVSSAEKSES